MSVKRRMEKHGYSGSKTYISWAATKSRCYNPNNVKYESYGKRGVKMCARWKNSFKNFLADMGERPDGKTLDRYPKKKGNYEPKNCRWATPKQQSANSEQPYQIEWRGQIRSLKNIAEMESVSWTCLYGRYLELEDIETAVLSAKNARRHPNYKLDTPWGKMGVTDVAKKIGITRDAMRYRLNHGWPKAKLFNPPKL